MFNTILFDLDGTLLPLNMKDFMELYFHEMGLKLKNLIDPKILVKYVLEATDTMVETVDGRTNEMVFMEKFGELTGREKLPLFQQSFNEFYDEGFLKVQNSTSTNAAIQQSIPLLKAKGYHLILATNPLFPEKAIHHRIKWAGFQPEDFQYITSYERNHYCKPKPQFYQEILTETNKQPEQCLMVGNDVQEDLIAGSLGLKTYLITNHLIHRTPNQICCDYQGDYDAFFDFVKELPPVAHHQ